MASVHMETGFRWQERKSDSEFVASVWICTTSTRTTRMALADPSFSISLVKVNQRTQIVLSGPKTKPFYRPLPPGYTCMTIRLKPGVFLKSFSPQNFINSSLTIPADAMSRFQFRDTQLRFPDFEHAELLVDRLHKLGYLGYASRSLVCSDNRSSLRNDARLVKRITGLSPYQLYQLQRAHQALRLLKQGVPAVEVASNLGFVDQPHLIRASKHFFGRTPKQLSSLPQTP